MSCPLRPAALLPLAGLLAFGCVTQATRWTPTRPEGPDAGVKYELRGPAITPVALAYESRCRPAGPSPDSPLSLADSRPDQDILPAAAETNAALPPTPPPVQSARLTVAPRGRSGMARVTLSLFDRPLPETRSTLLGRRSRQDIPRPMAVYTLDITQTELDLIETDLQTAGLFGDRERPRGGAVIEAATQGRRVAKSWTPEPRLDELIDRALREGTPAAAGG